MSGIGNLGSVNGSTVLVVVLVLLGIYIVFRLAMPKIRKTAWYDRHFRKKYALQEHMDLGKKPELLNEKEIHWGLRIGLIMIGITAIFLILTYLYVPHQVMQSWCITVVTYFASALATIPSIPLWAWIIIILFIFFPLSRLKPLFFLDNRVYFYYKITGANSGITAIYSIRHPKRPFVFYNVNMRHWFGMYWIQSADLMIRWSQKPNIVVVESLAAGEVRHITYLESELRMNQSYNQSLEKELAIRTGMSLDVIKQLLAAARGIEYQNPPPRM